MLLQLRSVLQSRPQKVSSKLKKTKPPKKTRREGHVRRRKHEHENLPVALKKSFPINNYVYGVSLQGEAACYGCREQLKSLVSSACAAVSAHKSVLAVGPYINGGVKHPISILLDFEATEMELSKEGVYLRLVDAEQLSWNLDSVTYGAKKQHLDVTEAVKAAFVQTCKDLLVLTIPAGVCLNSSLSCDPVPGAHKHLEVSGVIAGRVPFSFKVPEGVPEEVSINPSNIPLQWIPLSTETLENRTLFNIVNKSLRFLPHNSCFFDKEEEDVITQWNAEPSLSSLHKLQLVISRYAEDLSWLLTERLLQPYVSSCIIYNKGDADLPEAVISAVSKVVALPNVGKCDHTYLHHIVTGLQGEHVLADFTVFVPGSVLGEDRKKTVLWNSILEFESGATKRALSVHKEEFPTNWNNFSLDRYKTAFPPNALKNNGTEMLPAPIRPFGAWYQSVFGSAKKQAPCWAGGCFYARRSAIERNELQLYKNLLDQTSTHVNPEVGHYIERVWGVLLND